MGVEQGRESLDAVEADPEASRVAEDEREAVDHHLHSPDAEAVEAPIHLSLLGRSGLEASEDRSGLLGGSSQPLEVLLEDGQSAGVAVHAQLAEDPRRSQVLARQLSNEVVEWPEFGGLGGG